MTSFVRGLYNTYIANEPELPDTARLGHGYSLLAKRRNADAKLNEINEQVTKLKDYVDKLDKYKKELESGVQREDPDSIMSYTLNDSKREAELVKNEIEQTKAMIKLLEKDFHKIDAWLLWQEDQEKAIAWSATEPTPDPHTPYGGRKGYRVQKRRVTKRRRFTKRRRPTKRRN